MNPPVLFTMEGMERKETAFEAATGGAEQFEAQMSNFLASVRTGAAPVSNVDQAINLMRMLMAVYESSTAGAEVRLP